MNQHELSPVAEMDTKLRNPQRRRVPVACGRCRRRKIKCSGDSGDGQGCSNCRSAGNTDCQFLRVNSLKLTPKANSWPYPNPGAAMVSSPRLGKPTLLSMASPQTRMAAFQRASDYDLGSDGSVFPERFPVGVESMHYEDGQSAGYSQSPAYMHPNAPSGTGALFDYGASPWSPKTWDSVLGMNRPANSGLYPDPEANSSMNQSPFSYMLPSQGLPSTELPPSTIAAMAAVLSADLPGPERTLPTPTCHSQQFPSTAGGLVFSPTEAASRLSLPVDSKPAFWSPRCGPLSNTRTQTHPISNTLLFCNSPPTTTTCTTTASNSELLFACPPMPITTEENSPHTLSSTSVSTPPRTTPHHAQAQAYTLDTLDPNPNDRPNQEPSQISTLHPPDRSLNRLYPDRGTAGQRLLELTTDCTPDIYGYTSSEKSKARDSRAASTSGTLMSGGLEYTPVRHAHTPHAAFSFGILPDGLPGYHRSVVEGVVHRAPISPLGSQGGY
ncbi:uncharacterized protein N7482_001425 [Penicillium canariense]|uniref:Zn(2)-C6 fungal-type domain-containing protein n=1 Tax=Penicillium canariense TaxID=189055 RepID=A0A9W9LSX9_9EURO|nr:uncharacterized protein N7482_001425 [Penicillium canariense]KAJ5175548.1 hypothetical protein N7482_001425 [Penicillium canariense]